MSTIRSVGFRIDSTHSVSTRVHSGLHCRWWCLRLVSVIADVASGWVRAGLQLDDGASASECPLLPRDHLRDLSAVGGHLGGLSYPSGPSGALIQGDTGLLWRAWGVYWLGYEGVQQRLRVAFPSSDPGRNPYDCPHQTDAHSDIRVKKSVRRHAKNCENGWCRPQRDASLVLSLLLQLVATGLKWHI